MTTEEIFATRLRQALQKRHMTQTALCQAVGVSGWVVCHWCSGRQMPQSRYLPEIARELGVTTDWLLGVDWPLGPPPEPEPDPEPEPEPKRPARRKR